MAGPKPLLLVVDDDPLFVKSITLVLKSEYECVTAASGEEGIEKFKQHDPDLVLCDVKMGESTNGYELCGQIKKIEPRAPIILLTNFHDQQCRIKGLLNGADDYIGKHVENEELLLRIRNALISSGRLKYTPKEAINHSASENNLSGQELVRRLDAIFERWISNNTTHDRSALRLSEVSGALNLSTRSFQRKIMGTTKMDFSQYKQQYMLNCSLELLSEKHSIAEIANLLNYSSQSHFSHLFKRKFGLTPTQYRKQRP